MAAVTDFSQNRTEIIEAALRKIGALSLGQSVTASQMDAAVKALNLLVQSWQTKGLFLWTLAEFTLELEADVVQYTLEPGATGVTGLVEDIIGIDRAYWVDNDDDEPMEIWSYRQYLDELQKTSTTGQPLAISVKPTESPLTAYVWPSPPIVYTLKVVGIAKLRDWDNTTDKGGIPVRFQKALVYGLASDLAPEYGVPLAERNSLERQAEGYFKEAKRSDRDRSNYQVVKGAF
jgi:hypothetical protein